MPNITLSSLVAGALIVIVLSVFLPIMFDIFAYGVVAGVAYYVGRKRNSPD